MKFIWPCGSLANVLRGFWYAASFYYLGRHYAVDIAVPWWTPMKSSLAGKVAVRSYDSESGYKVYIDSAIGDGIIIRCCYRHMTGPAKVTIGSSVSQGQIIGYVGSTGNSLGPHLHFDLWTNKIIRDDSIVWKPAAGFYAVDRQLSSSANGSPHSHAAGQCSSWYSSGSAGLVGLLAAASPTLVIAEWECVSPA